MANKMLFALFLVLCLTATFANQYKREVYEELFYDYLSKYNIKMKDGNEFARRVQIFADNYDKIEQHNREGHTYTFAINHFAHLTKSEFRDRIGGGTHPPAGKRIKKERILEEDNAVDLKRSIDWVANGAVTAVKDQGGCGGCWAFSAVGALEGAYFIKSGSLQSFSEQELLSCDTNDSGCNGGWMDDAFSWVQSNGGITTEDQYPYTSSNGDTGNCITSGYAIVSGSAPTSYTDVQQSVSAVQHAVAQQPVSIAIESDEDVFQFYSSGVITSGCGNNLDHGVLIVGYGVLNGVPYWKVKNSWGTSWGMSGYVLISRGSDDQCGVLDAASYPNL